MMVLAARCTQPYNGIEFRFERDKTGISLMTAHPQIRSVSMPDNQRGVKD